MHGHAGAARSSTCMLTNNPAHRMKGGEETTGTTVRKHSHGMRGLPVVVWVHAMDLVWSPLLAALLLVLLCCSR